MTTTDPFTAAARAEAEVADGMDEWSRECFMSGAEWARTHLAVEVRKAKAEAWREYAAALEAVPDYAPTEYDKGRVDQRHATIEELYVHATEYETGDSDEHR